MYDTRKEEDGQQPKVIFAMLPFETDIFVTLMKGS
jgi:hypothetical protein